MLGAVPARRVRPAGGAAVERRLGLKRELRSLVQRNCSAQQQRGVSETRQVVRAAMGLFLRGERDEAMRQVQTALRSGSLSAHDLEELGGMLGSFLDAGKAMSAAEESQAEVAGPMAMQDAQALCWELFEEGQLDELERMLTGVNSYFGELMLDYVQQDRNSKQRGVSDETRRRGSCGRRSATSRCPPRTSPNCEGWWGSSRIR